MKIIKDLLRQMMLLYKQILYFAVGLFVKTDEHTVFFESFQGRSIACSPKALYEEMANNSDYKRYQFFWSSRTRKDNMFAENSKTTVVRFESFAYYRALAKSKYWILNSNPRPFLKPGKKHIFIQTWHGTPLKKIGCDVEKSGNAMTKLSDIRKIYTREAEKITYMISPSKYCTDKFISAFNMKSVGKENRVLTTGYPRNDFLFKYNETDCKKVKEQLKIPEDKKIILYAPTFRDNRYSATEGFRVNSYIDFDKVRGLLEDEFVILFRAHYFISEKLNVSKYEGFVYDVSEYDDINYLYIISDILITDYSSVFFDYANLKRPIIFYMEDMDEYKNQVRDFYIDINELPGPIVKSHDELIKYIDKMKNNFTIDDKYMKFNNKYNYLDGKDTSKKVLNKIVEN